MRVLWYRRDDEGTDGRSAEAGAAVLLLERSPAARTQLVLRVLRADREAALLEGKASHTPEQQRAAGTACLGKKFVLAVRKSCREP